MKGGYGKTMVLNAHVYKIMERHKKAQSLMNTISKDIVLVSKDHCVSITHKHCHLLEMTTWSEGDKQGRIFSYSYY
jgi:hypothetical protein